MLKNDYFGQAPAAEALPAAKGLQQLGRRAASGNNQHSNLFNSKHHANQGLQA